LRYAIFLICLSTALPAVEPLFKPLNDELPKWIRFGGDYRMRPENQRSIRFQDGAHDFYSLNRIRLNLTLTPTPYLKFFVQGQDARIIGNQRISSNPPNENTFDLRQAYVEMGDIDKRPISLRVGRQEITYGEERLVGASNWANAARSFDAVRLVLRLKGYRLDAFASSVVVNQLDHFDHHTQGDNLHGLYGSVSSWIPRAKVEPFLFWHVGLRVRGERGANGKLDLRTAGVRIQGELPLGFDYVTEMAFQNGSYAPDTVRAWAGHWRSSRKLTDRFFEPRLRLEYNHATGDANPTDGRHETFDVMYPTPHDKYGLADQVGWKNIHHFGSIVEFKPAERWTLQGKFHTWWLASARDGLYNAPGSLLFRDTTGRSGRHVGQELDVQALWSPTRVVQIGMGTGHLFPGEFLKNVSARKGYTFQYISVTYLFQ
jgi:hypothetical protein